MVNVGHPSRGCFECRRLKVKCDAAKPACERCQRSRKDCPGYAVGADSPRFRSMNETSEVKVQSRVRQRLADRGAPSSAATPAATEGAHTPSPLPLPQQQLVRAVATTSIAPPVPTDWVAQAVEHFFDVWVEPPSTRHDSFGIWAELPAQYCAANIKAAGATMRAEGAGGRAQLVRDAVQAAAMAQLGNTSSVEDFRWMGRRAYGRALASLGRTMQRPDDAFTVETLAAVRALAAYETVAGGGHHLNLIQNHTSGQSTLLKAVIHQYGSSALDTGDLLQTTNRGLLWRDLSDMDSPTLGYCHRSLRAWPPNFYRRPIGELSAQLSVQVINACDRLRTALRTPPDVRHENWYDEIRGVTGQVLAVNDAIHECRASMSQGWHRHQVPKATKGHTTRFLRPDMIGLSNYMRSFVEASTLFGLQPPTMASPEADGDAQATYPSRMDTFTNSGEAICWLNIHVVHFFAVRALIDLYLLDIQFPALALRPRLPTADALYEQLSTPVEDLCATIPFLMGDVDSEGNLRAEGKGGGRGMRPTAMVACMWGLHRLCRIPGTEPALRAWSLDVLSRIGHAGGLRAAFSIRRWNEPGGDRLLQARC